LGTLALPIAAGPGLVSLLARDEGHLVLLRYAMALAPLGAVAVGCAIATLPRRLAILLVVLALAGSIGYSASKNVYAVETRAGQDIRGAAAFLRQEVRAGDLLFVEPAHNWMALGYYGVETAPVEGRTEEWREVTVEPLIRRSPRGEDGRQGPGGGAQMRVPTAGTAWLVRFSIRTSAPRELLSRAGEARQFGTLTVLRVE
ncbi:MAG TPA: hypothetical protein VK911_08155, partial [Vicinamibacterales bacterium]|nr:hypothetical protein [Vicinamibacterales bacterium]